MPFLFASTSKMDVTNVDLLSLFAKYGPAMDCQIYQVKSKQFAYAILDYEDFEIINIIQQQRPHYLGQYEVLTRRAQLFPHPKFRNLIEDPPTYEVHVSSYAAGTPNAMIADVMSQFGNILSIEEKPHYQASGHYFGHCIVRFQDWDAVDMAIVQEELFIGGDEVLLATRVMEANKCEDYWTHYSSPPHRPRGILNNMDINHCVPKILGRKSNARKRPTSATVPTNLTNNTKTGQSLKRKRNLTTSSLDVESEKRMRFSTDISEEEAKARDSRIRTALESIMLLKNNDQLEISMQRKLETLIATEEEKELKLVALKSLSPQKDVARKEKEGLETCCQNCGIPFDGDGENHLISSQSPYTFIKILEMEIEATKKKRLCTENDVVKLRERVDLGGKNLTCPVCLLRKVDFINMCGHGACEMCSGQDVRCITCKATVTAARQISLKSQLENLNI